MPLVGALEVNSSQLHGASPHDPSLGVLPWTQLVALFSDPRCTRPPGTHASSLNAALVQRRSEGKAPSNYFLGLFSVVCTH